MLDVNTKALERFSKDLESISRSALPVAIRGALNDCAFNMKSSTLLSSAKTNFIERSPNFFKANSSYDKADGFDINTMKSTVGMTEGKLKGDKNYSVKDLEDQEESGTIEKKSFIPMLAARKGAARTMVRANARLKSIKNIVKASTMGGVHARQNFVLAVFKAGKGGYFLSKNTLWRVNSLNLQKSGDFKLTPLYSFDKGRKVHVKAHHFIAKAGNETRKKIDEYYIDRAEKAFEKHFRR
jgi:hypothetical protein